MKASDAFHTIKLTAQQEENLEDEEKEALMKKNKFDWHTEKGIIKKIDVLNKEFNQFRGLNPVKIMISGPPASGKTFYADMLAKYYNVPKVNVSHLLSEVWRFDQLDEESIDEKTPNAEFITSVKTTLGELREKEAERMQEEYDAKKKDDDEDFDPEAAAVKAEINKRIKIPNDILYKLLQIHLKHNDCRNRGYVLDGFPRTFKDAQHIFLYKPKKFDEEGNEIEEEEEELEEGQEKSFVGYTKDDNIFPSSCIVLNGDDKFLMQRVRDLPEVEIVGTHYNASDMTRRLKIYRTANNSQVAEPSVQDFFAHWGVKTFNEQVTTPTQMALSAFKIYIERVSQSTL